MSETTKYLLDESKMPRHWYNIAADLPRPAPPVLHPGTHQPVGPDDRQRDVVLDPSGFLCRQEIRGRRGEEARRAEPDHRRRA